MQNHPTTPFSQTEKNLGSVALLRLVIARHPYASALFFLGYWLALLLALGRVLAPVYFSTHMPFLLYDLISEVLVVLVVALPLLVLKWWTETGFTRGVNLRGFLISLLLLLLIAGPAVYNVWKSVGQTSGLTVAVALELSLLVGFAEEGMFRGVLLRALLPKGIWPAVLISALCFASVHFTNLFTGASRGYVLVQVILAFGTGTLLATLRLRTGSIWPGILIHAARDIAGLIYLGMNPAILQSTPFNPSNTINIALCLLYLAVSFLLLLPNQVRKLRIVYGLVKEPEATPPSTFPHDLNTPGVPLDQQDTSPYPVFKNPFQPAAAPNNPPPS